MKRPMKKKRFTQARVDEPYVMRGTYHGLANGLKIGWHVDFIDRLKHLLERA